MSYQKVSRWLAQWDLLQLLEQNDNLVKISNFLPPRIADEALRIVEAVPLGTWLPTAANNDPSQNNISHSFLSTMYGSEELHALLRVFSILIPDQLHVFSAAKYSARDHIAPHDDRAYVPIRLEDTQKVITCSRDIAVIYYLTKDWKREMGGLLIDLPSGQEFVPEFNSLVAFRIPRYHEVTAVATLNRPRLSIFGWFLQPGKTYDLNLVGHGEGEGTRTAGGARGPQDPPPKTQKKVNAGKRKGEESDGGMPHHKCKLAQRIIANSKKKKKDVAS